MWRDHMAKAQKMPEGVAVVPSRVSMTCMPDAKLPTWKPCQKM
jgi:hypothetical protein